MNVYADNAATTRMSQAAVDAMLPFLRESYGNPSSLYTLGQKAAESLQASRETMAKYLGCDAVRSRSRPAAARRTIRPC